MKRLWAPWRKVYIRPEGKRSKVCPFCRIKKGMDDKKNYILKRTPTCYAVLNLYPYNNGHVLIVPNRHVDSFSKLSDDENIQLLNLADQVMVALQQTMGAQGVNMGVNLGRAAGAGIPDHLHMHLVPRWIGDGNFMPIIANTKVISESLGSVFEALFFALNKKKRSVEK